MTAPVSKQQRIRVSDAQGASRRRIASQADASHDTVAKYAGKRDCSPEPGWTVRRPSKPDACEPVVDGWLEADRLPSEGFMELA